MLCYLNKLKLCEHQEYFKKHALQELYKLT